MSHFTTVKTEIYELETLKDVIHELGYNLINDKELLGYGEAIQHVAFQVEVKNGYNIGFRKESKGYNIIGDKFMNPNYHTVTRSILQNYAQKIVMRNMTAMGYTTVNRTVGKDNTIKLVLVK